MRQKRERTRKAYTPSDLVAGLSDSSLTKCTSTSEQGGGISIVTTWSRLLPRELPEDHFRILQVDHPKAPSMDHLGIRPQDPRKSPPTDRHRVPRRDRRKALPPGRPRA